MSTSKIKIYKTDISPSKNMKIDGLDDYLSTCPITYQDDTFQYLQLGLDISIKINAAQANITKMTPIGNYIRLEQDDTT